MSDNKKWERESDARTLTEATEIKLNPKKLKAAFRAVETRSQG